ncbi:MULTISPECIES: PTS sugar transporter subunit IIB [Priestia]|jgi:PTS system ascorbate-specific IIB component|uniref:PTS sugar transporter subunit IIB n=1 Tax=Priestia TaxID=2800373 RepID=UPI00245368C4|nr:PTS sugar transporter subunit IIB [Priestia megaterium]MDH3141242.1 PTS sugar transporter subunit IIB [Priestia megaterium]MED4240067.1 PTS sugar transporter subunit IIB [Priestia megaterium]MED4252555.1 PTS sugar transporter subunit IIB [Priestia megaterium]MED4265242.1 PTS sugar transporter subunit IIB [Priestia megaterium]MED4278758.1 PTS sugar transporter subunit IIB [Priestia megaterium]
MKILTVCGSGLGTSFMVEMNIQQLLNEMGVSGVEVNHSDLGSATPEDADVFFLAKDIAEGGASLGNVVILDNIIDLEELRTKLTGVLQEKKLL